MLAFNAPFPEFVLQIGAVLSSLSLDVALVDPVCAGIPSDAYSKVADALLASFYLCVSAFFCAGFVVMCYVHPYCCP